MSKNHLVDFGIKVHVPDSWCRYSYVLVETEEVVCAVG